MISIIVAATAGGLIGAGGKLPWHIPEEMRHFRDTTMGHPVIMGRKTWDGLPDKYRPLPGRSNVVITTHPGDTATGATFVSTPELAVSFAGPDAYVIGGASVYRYFLEKNMVDRILLSRVKGDYKGDAYFPAVDHSRWAARVVARHDDFDVIEYLRR